jgi:HD-like signal output (HDOD) protein/CheY-like chemotaxis protein
VPRRILFVDDEPMVLSGLKRSLHAMRHDWVMEFASSGEEALQAMSIRPFDVIVTDVRMPVMDGAQLLEEIKRHYPQCLRFVLSGQADLDTIMKTVNPAHQFLSKPCDGAELQKRLTRALGVKNLLQNEELRGLVSKLESLPALPSHYTELYAELNKPEPSMPKIGKLVSEDMALTAKVLQLVNSAFFGLPGTFSNSSRAVQMLGLEIIRALVLSSHVFSKFQTDLLNKADMEHLWQTGFAAGTCAKGIAALEKVEQRVAEECFTAGLLHGVGKVVLASTMRDQYRQVLALVKSSGVGLAAAEAEVLGCSHAEVGAYLLSLWGLPERVIEGVAWHQRPSESGVDGFSTVLTTHVASIYSERQNTYWLADRTPLDSEYLEKVGYLEKEKEWEKAVRDAPQTR